MIKVKPIYITASGRLLIGYQILQKIYLIYLNSLAQ